jgi:maleate isomerase
VADGFVLGTITPSGNRTVERVVQAMLADLPGASAHFTRIPVVGDTGGIAGYDMPRMLDAATLLSHALPDVLSWNGTKGGVLGFDVDRELVAAITRATGLACSTSALAFLDALKALSARRIALVTPYDDAYQTKCIKAFARQGFETVSERHSGLVDNFSYGLVSAGDIVAMTRAAVAEVKPDAVIYFCTNFLGAEIAPVMERELGLPVLDSTALGVWGAMRAVGRKPSDLARWGRVFTL